jgi:hypothetical protein
MNPGDIFWQLCDPDAEIGTTFREGVGFESLTDALVELTGNQKAETPEGMIPSGNLTIYWNEVQPQGEVIHASFTESKP